MKKILVSGLENSDSIRYLVVDVILFDQVLKFKIYGIATDFMAIFFS